MAWAGLSPTSSSSGFLGHFLLGFSTTFASAMPMEVVSLEVLEFAEFVKGDIVDRHNLFWMALSSSNTFQWVLECKNAK